MARGADQVAPWLVYSVNRTSGRTRVPLTYVMTIRSVASAPVGAPLAMSTLGAGARSLRAPAIPSMTGRPCTGSTAPGWVTGPATACGFDQVCPPLAEVTISSNESCPAEETVPTPNTYATPWLSVRTVQPSIGLRWPLLAAAVTWCTSQVVPPSWETPTFRGAGAALPFSWPTKLAQHTYTEPKNGLREALSAQICSLSENVVLDCLEMTTGGIQALLTPAVAAATLSVRDTAIASKPLIAGPEVRFE